MNAASNIIIECKKLGIELNVPPVKLKQGAGDAVVTVLNRLLERTIQSKRIRYGRPKVRDEDENQEFQEMFEEEGALLSEAVMEDDDLMEEQIESPTKGEDDDDQNAIIESNIDAHEWKIECERVAPQLKLRDEGKDKGWRQHIDQAKKYKVFIKDNMPELQTRLFKMSDELSKTLDKIQKKEDSINRNMDPLADD